MNTNSNSTANNTPGATGANPAATTNPSNPAPTTPCPIEALKEILVQQYHAVGQLEIMFCRRIAAAEITANSIQDDILRLTPESDPHRRLLDRLTLAQTRTLRHQANALKELKDLQDRRNLAERFPAQVPQTSPLADHSPFIGTPPKINPAPARLQDRPTPPPGSHHKSPLETFDNLERFLTLKPTKKPTKHP